MIRIAPAILFALTVAACSDPQSPPVIPPVPMPEPEPAPVPLPPPIPTGGYAAVPAPGEELPPSQTTPGPVPLEFRHVWAIDAKDCAANPGLTRIAIAPGAIRFYEGRAVVASTDLDSSGKLTLQVDHMSEGQTERQTHVLALTNDGQGMTYQRAGETFAYARCD